MDPFTFVVDKDMDIDELIAAASKGTWSPTHWYASKVYQVPFMNLTQEQLQSVSPFIYRYMHPWLFNGSHS